MSHTSKRIMKYIVYVLLFYALFYLGIKYGNHLNDIAKRSFNIFSTSLMIYKSIFPILLGLIMGLPNLIKKFKEQGKWRADWVKLAIFGAPTLYLGLNSILMKLSGEIGILFYPKFLLITNVQQEMFYTLNGFIFGYIVLDSLYRKSE